MFAQQVPNQENSEMAYFEQGCRKEGSVDIALGECSERAS